MNRMSNLRAPIVAALAAMVLCLPAAAQEGDDSQSVKNELKALRDEISKLQQEVKGLKAQVTQLKRAAQPKPTNRRQPDTTVYSIDIGDSPVRGPEDAKVTIVEYVDIQCPFCAREEPVIKQVLSSYPDDVRYVFKHFPLSFHKQAKPAHAALELARKEKGDEGFWKMHDLVMANPKDLKVSTLRGYAEQVGLDLEEFDAVMADESKQNELLKDDMMKARQYNVRGTPTVFINGLKLSPRGLDNYKKRIDALLKGSEQKVDRG